MLVMNLSIAAVIEGLDTAKKENLGIVQTDEIEEFIDYWCDYDPYATGFISLKNFIFLLYELPPPMGKVYNFEMDEYDEMEENKIKQRD